MDVTEMPVKLIGVADRVFPEPLEPHATGALPQARLRPFLFHSAGREVFPGEHGLDVGDADGEIRIADRQRDAHVHVVGQENNGLQVKRMMGAAPLDCGVKDYPRGFAREDGRTPLRDQGEKERPTRTKCADVRGHGKRCSENEQYRMRVIPLAM